MKFIISTIISIIGYNAFSQTPVIDLFDHTGFRNVPEAYYKDTHNNFSPFLGTWTYQSNGTILTLKLEKLLQYFDPEYLTYEDFVVGEYRYVVNNVEKINTFSNFNLGLTNPYRYNLFGSAINTAENFPECSSCQPFEKRLLMMFNDPSLTNTEGLSGQLVIRRIVNSTPPKIEVWLKQEGNIYYEAGSPQPVDAFTVPWGTYVLTKVE